MSNAIHPDMFKDFREARVLKEATTADEVEKEEQMFADFAETGTWGYLKQYILELTDVLESLKRNSMEAGASFEEIGQKTVVVELAKTYLMRVIEKVEDAKNSRTTA